MPGLSQLVKRGDDYREILFWLLLLGNWQCLVAPRGRYTVLEAVGTAVFLAFACRNLGRLKGLGLAYAAWLPATRPRLRVAAVSGLVAGAGVLAIGSANGKSMMLSDDWGLVVLQVTLGPVLEEVVFRGYLFAVLTWCLSKFTDGLLLDRLVVVTSAEVFALAHFTQPEVSWLQCASPGRGYCMVGSAILRSQPRFRRLRTPFIT